MKHKRRTNIISGILLILFGIVLLAVRVMPGWLNITFTWPVLVMMVGAGLLILGLLTSTPDLAVPACIVGGIGGILYVQNQGILPWDSWSYIWALIPGFVGLGEVLSGLIKGKPKEISEGLQTILVSVVLLVIFGSLFGDLFTFFSINTYLPLLLIAVGVFMFVRELLRARK